MEEHGSRSVFHQFGVPLNGVDPELQELPLVTEEDGSWGLLVVAAVTGVEHLDADLTLLVGLSGCDGEAG